MASARRITLVTDEILGVVRTAGAGTANTFLAFALARLGHDVEILLTGLTSRAAVEAPWAQEYSARGIELRRVEEPRERIGHAFASAYAVQEALRADPPELVVAHDCYAPGYAALRSRQLGLAFSDTAFAIYCHGTTGWTYEAHRKLRRWPPSFEFQALERASIELADVVVSPSAYMLDWMRSRGWEIQHPVVAPYFTRSSVDGGVSQNSRARERIRRLVFFGRLEERKGIEPFVAALNDLQPELLSGVELLFLGRDTKLWPVARVADAIADTVKANVASLRFETGLDQHDAIALLQRPGTLAVMPSLVDNSPNVIYECLEHGIPFLSSNAGGGPELVVEEDRGLSFVTPTGNEIRAGLARILSEPEGVPLARASFGAGELLSTWEDVVTSTVPAQKVREHMGARVSAIVRGGNGCVSLAGQTRAPDEVVSIAHGGLEDGLRKTTGELVLLLDEQDELDADCLETLLRALSSGVDVVTCGVRNRGDEVRLFVGEARELGLIGNYYGLVGLYRRSVLENGVQPPEVDGDVDWLLLASASHAGARVASVPRPLVSSTRIPGSIADGSGAAFAVLQAFERAPLTDFRELPWLAASLAAVRTRASNAPPAGLARRVVRRAVRVLRRGSVRLRGFRELRGVEPHTIERPESRLSGGT